MSMLGHYLPLMQTIALENFKCQNLGECTRRADLSLQGTFKEWWLHVFTFVFFVFFVFFLLLRKAAKV